MIIDCPHCGSRDSGEFFMRGQAAGPRPEYADGQDAFAVYVYDRTNLAGMQREHWYHAAGCRSWLVVERDTRSHVVGSVAIAGKAVA
ncbi:sarcosine oxidase subunit delta [Croceicoccus ponticola]|uniref:Sarcosine oxidase subunit delta n=1 Tax=Croceicoccus ponticola TaxID=2217664 RepID=A0A437GU21_9SPHN|nr:sarcosine oxidase subunit delta [Croceicoccus ponticola]RVQ64628.1 sarcosine oxidase subunit delta [Croceicoccus ponticola]